MSKQTISFQHAALLQMFQQSHATIEDIARAWASMDGKRQEFDNEKHMSVSEAIYGHYLGYICETEEIFRRAIAYADERAASK